MSPSIATDSPKSSNAAASPAVLVHQIIEHTLLTSLGVFQHFLTQLFFYGLIGPVLAVVTLTWISRRVRERDEAGQHLNALSEVSREGGATAEIADLVQIALRAPSLVLGPVGTSVVSRDGVMVMEGDAMDGMEGGAMDGMEGGAMDGIEEHHGFMVLQNPSSGQTVIEFTVPDKTGEWEFACFEDEGAHYDDGMHGTLKVVAS